MQLIDELSEGNQIGPILTSGYNSFKREQLQAWGSNPNLIPGSGHKSQAQGTNPSLER